MGDRRIIHIVNSSTVKLGDIVRCARMQARRCTHFLDKGVVPLGEQQRTGRGRHRTFSLGQAFLLILAYRLSELGVPLRQLKRIVHAVHNDFDQLKQSPVSDDFCPPREQLRSRYEWCLLISRGYSLVIVPEKYIAAWLDGDVPWYSLRHRKLETPAASELNWCWLKVPFRPIERCLVGLDIPEINP